MVNIHMGKRLKFLRQANHLTLKQVAERVGISVSVLSAYETPLIPYTLKTLYPI